MSFGAKLELMNSLHDSIATELKADEFEEVSESELRRQTGKSTDDLLREATGTLPFGRDQRFKIAQSFRILFKDTGMPCTRRGGVSGVAAYLMGMQPVEGVQRDFGGVCFIVARIGACAVSSDARSYTRDLLDRATEKIVDALDRR
jgi:hypothetical protein